MSELDNEVKQETDNQKNFKKEKRIDYQNTESKVNVGQETVRKSTIQVYNPTNVIIEIDLGRDKSVRIPPYSNVELNSEAQYEPGFEVIKQLVKIY